MFLPARRLFADDTGMATVEYSVALIAAAAFAVALYSVVSGQSVLDGLTTLVQNALSTGP